MSDEGKIWEPTLSLRWLEGVGLETGAYCVERVLQQKWIEQGSGAEEWREIPVTTERAELDAFRRLRLS